MPPKKNRPRYHLVGPTAPFMCSSYCKQAPPTLNTAPPTVNWAPLTVNTACCRNSWKSDNYMGSTTEKKP